MDCCKYKGCTQKRGIHDGFCRTHSSYRSNQLYSRKSPTKGSTSKVTNEAETATMNGLRNDIQELHAKMDQYLDEIKHLKSANLSMSNQMGEMEEMIGSLKKENTALKAKSNVRFFKHDALNQYGRHENLRIYNIPEAAEGVSENCIQHVKDVAQKLDIALNDDDIERCHRLGSPRDNGTNRPIIVRFGSFNKKKQFVANKKKLRIPDDTFKNLGIEERKNLLAKTPFLAEDLTPFRNHIFIYIRNYNSEKKLFDVVTSHYGQIVVKEKDKNIWHRISSTDDFLKAGIDFDAEEFKDEIL